MFPYPINIAGRFHFISENGPLFLFLPEMCFTMKHIFIYDYRVEWCAIFISWCANNCGYIGPGIIPKFEGVRPGVAWFQERGQWQGRDNEPQPGDIIFLDWESDGLADHVGIVEYCEDGVVHTVEGNAGDMVKQKQYTVGNSPIYGYGIPAY